MTSIQPDLAGLPDYPAILPAEDSPFAPEAEVVVEGNPVLDRFWVTLRHLPKYLKLTANLARDGQVPMRAKAALVVGGVYTVSPVDLVPGIIPVAGQLDDMAVLLLAIRTAIRACPPEVAARQLERAGLTADDFNADLESVRDTVVWLGAKGFRMSKKFAIRGGKQIGGLWKTHIHPR